MIEEVLINYGVAGAMLVYFVTDKFLAQQKIQKVIEQNTIALSTFIEATRKCNNRNI